YYYFHQKLTSEWKILINLGNSIHQKEFFMNTRSQSLLTFSGIFSTLDTSFLSSFLPLKLPDLCINPPKFNHFFGETIVL
ncbi:MAG TPA: hypothetical protein VKI62_04730, partial [Bacteroidota bacterium]|nr:hypothetical protein [Bacteroidota bacterium]